MAGNKLLFTFQIGHVAALKSKKDVFGMTHDWQLYVKGINSQGENAEMAQFVDKVVFNLHDSFPKPKRTIKDPPYIVKESGYAGFELTIDIYFKNESRDDPKKVTFSYDLDLTPSKAENKEYMLENVSDDFKRKCIRGGCVILDDYKSRDYKANTVSSTVSDASKKAKRPEDEKTKAKKPTSYFTELFGDPIEKSSAKVLSKSNEKPPPPAQAAVAPASSSTSSVAKDKASNAKDKSRSNKHGDDVASEKSKKDKFRERERFDKKEKSMKRAASPLPPPQTVNRNAMSSEYFKSQTKQHQMTSNNDQQQPPAAKKSKKKSSEKDRDKLDNKKESKSKDKIKPDSLNNPQPSSSTTVFQTKKSSKESQEMQSNSKNEGREKPIKTSAKDLSTLPSSSSASAAASAAITSTSQSDHSKKKEERDHKHKKKGKSKDKEKNDRVKSQQGSSSKSNKYNYSTANTQLSDESDMEMGYNNNSSNSSKLPAENIEHERKPAASKKTKQQAEKEDTKSRKRAPVKESNNRDSSSSPLPPLPQPKAANMTVNAFENNQDSSSSNVNSHDTKITSEYLQELKELKHKITSLKVNDQLQQIIRLIAASGCYEITKSTFDFDLVRLDKTTVQRLQDFFQ